jgi:hypothetical protein
MDFALPLDEYARDGINLVLWGEPRMGAWLLGVQHVLQADAITFSANLVILPVDEPYKNAPSYFGLNVRTLSRRL